MGYNSKCRYQDCYYNCCNTQGNCPSAQSQCKYYYTTENNTGMIAGSSVGAVVGVMIIIAIICYCYRRRQQQAILEQVQMQVQQRQHLSATKNQLAYTPRPTYSQHAHPNPAYAPAYPPASFAPSAYSQPSFGQLAYGDPMMAQPQIGQPAYGQPAYNQSYPQQPYGQTMGTQPTQNAIIVTNM